MSHFQSMPELDLSKYLQTLWRRWWLIAAGALLGALCAYLYSTTQPIQYRADAKLALIRTDTVIALDQRLRTVSDTDLSAQSFDQLLRRRSLLVLAENQELGAQVLEEIGPQAELDSPTAVKSHVVVALDGDVLRVQATMPTADKAAQLANAYARTYARRINSVLGSMISSKETLRAKTEQAKHAYQVQQKAIADFMASGTEQILRRRAGLLTGQLEAGTRAQIKLGQLEQDALALRERIANGTAVALPGTQLAQLLLEASAFNNTSGESGSAMPSLSYQPVITNLPNPPLAEQLKNLDDLIAALQKRRAAAEQVMTTGRL